MSGLGDKIAAGISWSILGQVIAQGGQLAVSLLLARVLAPHDFGLLAMVAFFTGIASLFTDFGLGAAIVQGEEVDQRQLSTIFWLNLGLGLVLTALFALAAPWVAVFYEQPRLEGVTIAMGASFALGALAMVPQNLLTRRMRFGALTAVNGVAVLGAGALAVALALAGWGVWALVAQTLARAALLAVGCWWAGGWRPSLGLDLGSIREMLRFGGNLLGSNLVSYAGTHLDDLLVGRIYGAGALGIYDRAYQLMLLPLHQISGVITRVMFPALSQIQADRPQVKALWLRGMQGIALATFPLMTLMFVAPEALVVFVLGEQWAPVAPLLRILAPIGMMNSIGTTVGWIYLSQGRSDWMFRWSLGANAVRIGGIVIGAYFGVEGVAWGYAISMALLFYPLILIPGRLVDLRFAEMVRALLPTLGCATVMGAAIFAVQLLLLPAKFSAGGELAVVWGVGLPIYGAAAQVVGLPAWREVLARLRALLSR